MKTIAFSTLLLVTATSPTGLIQTPSEPALVFVAELTGKNVAPEAVETSASSRATAVLVGNRFTVHGSFVGLTSPLRDIAKTPDDPGIHLHRGAPGETTRYFHGLKVKLNSDERSGIFFGSTTLDEQQRTLLLSNQMYVDIHTVKHGPGELRDQWRPLDSTKAAEILTNLDWRLATPTVRRDSARVCH
jgi:hypothetical protein